MKGYVTCECGIESCMPTHPEHVYKVCVNTPDSMLFTWQCECGRYITAHIAYNIIESTIEQG